MDLDTFIFEYFNDKYPDEMADVMKKFEEEN